MEEDIKILEELTKGFDNLISYKQKQAIENLIARYKELEENLNYRIGYCYRLEKELYGENEVELTKLEDKYYIPKSKVQEKIEEIKNTGIDVAWEQINYSIKEQDKAKIQVLKELLED